MSFSGVFSEFLSKAWSDHGNHPEQTAQSLPTGLELCKSPDDVISLVNLTAHLYTEHHPKFIEGERHLREFAKNSFAKGTPAEFAVARTIAAFRMCEGTLDPETDRMGLTPGDLARALGFAASALSVRDSVRAEKFLKLALSLVASLELTATDGIARGMAIAGNNASASVLELSELPEQCEPTEQQRSFMLLAAETARKYWEIAGTWLETERAEHHLANCYLRAGKVEEAREHAKLCLSISESNGALPLEMFFALEGLGKIEKVTLGKVTVPTLERATEWFDKIAEADKTWAQASFDKLQSYGSGEEISST